MRAELQEFVRVVQAAEQDIRTHGGVAERELWTHAVRPGLMNLPALSRSECLLLLVDLDRLNALRIQGQEAALGAQVRAEVEGLLLN